MLNLRTLVKFENIDLVVVRLKMKRKQNNFLCFLDLSSLGVGASYYLTDKLGKNCHLLFYNVVRLK